MSDKIMTAQELAEAVNATNSTAELHAIMEQQRRIQADTVDERGPFNYRNPHYSHEATESIRKADSRETVSAQAQEAGIARDIYGGVPDQSPKMTLAEAEKAMRAANENGASDEEKMAILDAAGLIRNYR